MNIPRIRARVGLGEDNKYYFEISLWTFDGETKIFDPFTVGPWETEIKAHEEMNKAVQLVCEQIEKSKGLEPSGKYIDLKNGAVLRPWQQH